MTAADRPPPALQPGARLAFVVNPVSRRGHDRESIDEVARALRERYVVDIVTPTSADAVEQTVSASAAAHDAIIIAGGDGTIHRAVCGLDGAPTPLGVIPMGTGNDFARGCGIPTPPLAAAARIVGGRTRRVDLVRVNGRIYGTVGLVGVGSAVALTVATLTRPGALTRGLVRLFGDWSYRLAGLAHLLAPGDITETVRIGGPSGEELRAAAPVFAVFVANTNVLGGGLVLPIDADDSDGLLEIALVPRMARLKLLWAFLCFTRGRPVPEGTLSVCRASRAVISCAREVPFSADGDLLCRAATFEVEAIPGALTLLC